jgi:3-methyladenine DNA glycosylase AlkD
MQTYMKSTMPYHGVPAALLAKVCKGVFADMPLTTASLWRAQVLELWRGAKFREERYAALHLAGDKRARSFQTPEAMTLYEELVVNGAWWDCVDSIASHRIGGILAGHPTVMQPKMQSWSRSDNMWKRRSAIICQLDFKADTDLPLLYAYIEPSLASREFFLQKAIGWALRQYAWTDAAEIERYVQQHSCQLSALSRREALKNID